MNVHRHHAKESLRTGTRHAISTLGTGFLTHPANDDLRERFRSRTLLPEDYKRAVLRMVYRLLFWFILEDRQLLLNPKAPPTSRARYTTEFSAGLLRECAQGRNAHQSDGLWENVRAVFTALGTDGGRPDLGIPGIGGIFERISDASDRNESLPDELDEPLEGACLTNGDLLSTVRLLAIDEGASPLDFREFDSEDLGSIYESLLALQPQYDQTGPAFTLAAVAGNERKTSGSYYTPQPLVEALLDSTLDPLLDDALRSADTTDTKIAALLDLTICDPACGSGRLLIAAARRISQRIARLHAGTDNPSPQLVRAAMREVITRCIYGVDINEMAAELTKITLWLESVEPGTPLAFLDANIRVGNALLGTTPTLIERGIPAAVSKTPAEYRNTILWSENGCDDEARPKPSEEYPDSGRPLSRLSDVFVQRKRQHDADGELSHARIIADTWCAAFLQTKTPGIGHVITGHTLQAIVANPAKVHESIDRYVKNLARDHRLFHWHTEFPHIFRGNADHRGGFSCVIGNPPWERVKIQEQEFFACRQSDIARAKNAATRRELIRELANSTDPADRRLHAEFTYELRRAEGQIRLIRDSGRYPLTGRGDINTYAVFAELGRSLIGPRGRVGMVVPTGIATDATTRYFFHDLVTTRTLVSLYDFENEEKLFPGVHHSYRFCLWTGSGRHARQTSISLAFRLRSTRQIDQRRFHLQPDDLSLVNPNTVTCPVFDDRRDARIVIGIYRRIPVLWREKPTANPWRVSFLRMLDMASDSDLFHDRETLETNGWELHGNIFLRMSTPESAPGSAQSVGGDRMLPLYEAKMVHHFDHRFGSYHGQTRSQANVGILPRPDAEQKNDPDYTVLPRYWVPEKAVIDRMKGRIRYDGWLLGWRDVCRSSDVRTLVAAVIPHAAVGHKFLLALAAEHDAALLQANLSSFIVDYCARQKIVGTCLSYSALKQLPILPPDHYLRDCPWEPGKTLVDWVKCRALELSYTSDDMEAFARHHSDTGPPFRWNEERRHLLRAELDAAYFHLYGVTRDDVDYVMSTFRAFQNRYPERFASTKDFILGSYDAMAHAIRAGHAYQTIVSPIPGRGPRHTGRGT